jgi:hypothetical protein
LPPPDAATVGFTGMTGATDGGACARFGPGDPPSF